MYGHCVFFQWALYGHCMGTVRALYGHWVFPLRCSCAVRLEYEKKPTPKICFFIHRSACRLVAKASCTAVFQGHL